MTKNKEYLYSFISKINSIILKYKNSTNNFTVDYDDINNEISFKIRCYCNRNTFKDVIMDFRYNFVINPDEVSKKLNNKISFEYDDSYDDMI